MWQSNGIIAYIINLNRYHTMLPFVNLCAKFNCSLLWAIHGFDSWLCCLSDHLCKSLNITESVATLYQMVHVWINELLKSHIWWTISDHVLLMQKDVPLICKPWKLGLKLCPGSKTLNPKLISQLKIGNGFLYLNNIFYLTETNTNNQYSIHKRAIVQEWIHKTMVHEISKIQYLIKKQFFGLDRWLSS